MALLFYSVVDRADAWSAALKEAAPELDVRIWPDVGAPEEIDYALVWQPPPRELARYPNLRLIVSLGAGVDHIFDDPDLPTGVPIVRVVDDMLTESMSEYVVLHVLRYHRSFDEFARQQREHVWNIRGDLIRRGHERPVGIMGQGVIGRDAAAKLAALGFDVAGWSRTEKHIDGVTGYHGNAGLGPFLARTEILVCLLPLTRATAGILHAATFAALPDGAFLINAARGEHLVEEDLIPALDANRLGGATLDVFHEEPLPGDHPFWDHPRITITPHNAAITDHRTVARQVAENIRRLEAGNELLHEVDPAIGY